MKYKKRNIGRDEGGEDGEDGEDGEEEEFTWTTIFLACCPVVDFHIKKIYNYTKSKHGIVC